MPFMRKGGSGSPILRADNGKIARTAACCCGCCCLELPEEFDGIFTNGCGSWFLTFRKQDIEFPDPCKTYYESDVVDILCNPEGQGGAGPICDTTRTGKFMITCVVPEGESEPYLILTWDFDCPPTEPTPICLTGAPETILRVTCRVSKDARYALFQEVPMPCSSCSTDPCVPNTVEINW